MQGNDEQRFKPVTRYVVLLFLPYVLLVGVALFQMIFMFAFSTVSVGPTVSAQSIQTTQSDNSSYNLVYRGDEMVTETTSQTVEKTVVSVLSIVGGVAGVVLLILSPLWVYFIIVNSNYNNKLLGRAKSKQVSVALAVAFGLFGLLYTYDADKTLFWILLVVTLLTAGFVGFIAWIIAVVIALSRNDEYYYTFPPQRVAASSPL